MHFILDTNGGGDGSQQIGLHLASSATGVFSRQRKPTPSTTTAPSSTPVRHWYRLFLSPLWLYFILAIVVRAWLVMHTNGVIDGDEALVGIQAEHILHGELPIYFYGQPYMGSLEAYLAALLFAIFGASVWTLRAEPTLLSLVVIWLTWKLAGILADIAGLSPRVKRFFMTVAVLGAAVPPLYDTVVELRMLGGYIETFVLMLWLLLSVVQLVRRWTVRATRRELALRWAGIGFIIGLGFWVDPLIISAIFASGVWIIGYCLITLRKEWHRPTANGYTLWYGFPSILTAIPAAIIGSAPAIYWGYYNHWANFAYVFARSGGSTIVTVSRMAPYYVACVAPHVIGGALLNESAASTALHIVPLALNLFCCLATIALVVASLFRPHPFLLQMRRLVGFPLFFGFCTAIFFCIGNLPSDCQHDPIGRFAAPLMLVLPIFIATVLAGCIIWLYEYHKKSENEGHEETGQGEKEIGLPQAVTPTMDNSNKRMRASMVMQRVLLLVLLATLIMQGGSYGLANAATTFQSPSCMIAPANNDAILAYLQQNHIHYAWAISWIAYPLDFKANGSIILADPRPAIMQPPTAGRLPATTTAVLAANRPSMLVFIKHGDTHSVLIRILNIEHITYRAAVFPSEPGTDVLVVTPLNRTISVFSSLGFHEVFAPC
jgi:hypothetical protein